MANSISILSRKIFPQKAWNFLKLFYFSFYFSLVQWRYKKIVRQIRIKDKIKVVFFISHASVWKYEDIYRLMEKHPRFEPLVVIIPFIAFGEEVMYHEMDNAYKMCCEKGYKVVSTLNKHNHQWLDVKKVINPDIVFFHAPYHSLSKGEYFISNFLDRLSCYVPYTFQTTFHYQQNYNGFFHNVLWRAYYPTTIHYNIAVQFAQNKGRNVIVTGYPFIDRFLNSTSATKKIEKVKLKKNIIWAPHHTIDEAGGDLHFSNFIRYHQFMVQLAVNYKNSVYITFKPHPTLRPKLISNIWGKEKTDAYFKFWDDNDFCGLNEGNYQSLFEASDAMIHDCDSFMGEYLSLNKPVLYTRKDNRVKDRMNEFGRSANDVHYQAKNEQEIVSFIDEVVIAEMDRMKEVRTNWIKTQIMPPHNRTASLNIFEDLKASLNID